MRPLLLVSLGLLACSSSFETRQVTTVQVVRSVATSPLVVAEGTIPPPRVVTPVLAPVVAPPVVLTPVPSAPLVVAGDGAPTLRCPTAQRALAGTPVHLRAEAQGQGLRFRWTVTRSPQARYYRFSERFDANDSDGIVGVGAEVPFTSVIVGDYTVLTEVRDSDGRTASCETQVTMAGHGLRVELSWNTSNTDVDLHMIRSSAPRWVSQDDCYYGNRQPDTAGRDEPQRRWLDTDDTDGEGPENIRVDVPEAGELYQVGVHYYSSHGNTGATTAIVVVYCGEQQAARFERDLDGSRSPNDNQFWRVAGVRFRGDGSCEVTRLPGAAVMPQSQLAGPGLTAAVE